MDGIFLALRETAGAGMRLAVKDLFDTCDLVTTYGSILFVDHLPDSTAGAVSALEGAGYENVGKTNLHEFAYGTTSENPHFGTVPNPVAPGRIAGGSSGGTAAALAAGLAEAGLGTDSGGSIRIPAACCGITGFKPTHGLVSLEGCFPLAPSFDHAGPMGLSVADCESMLQVLAPRYLAAEPVSLEELDVVVSWIGLADPLVRARVEQVADRFPGRRDLELPFPDAAVADVFMHEVADVHRELFSEHGDLYGENVATKIERCLAVSDAAHAAGAAARERYRDEVTAALDGADLVLTPTLAIVAPPVGVGDIALRSTLIRFTFPFNALGWPALALPCGPAEDGLPASVQLVGRPGADALVLAAGRTLEASGPVV